MPLAQNNAPEQNNEAVQKSEGHEAAHDPRSLLKDDDPANRRRAARALAHDPTAVQDLASRLAIEIDPSVSAYLLDALVEIGGDDAVAALTPFLRLDDANLRNGAVQALQKMPGAAEAIEQLLYDDDADVRIMTVDILQEFAAASAAGWLGAVLEREDDINVIGVALDRLAEIGGPEQLEPIRATRIRFASEPYIVFACDAAIVAIEGAP